MSRSKHQYHPDWRSKHNKKTLKYKKYKLKPYGICWFCGYNDFYKGGTEKLYNETIKGRERRNNKININNLTLFE